jgi:preprotein translocase subunit SecG
MQGIIKIIQVFLVVILIVLILIQSKGGGLSLSVGSSFSMYRSRRGVEKVVFVSTIVFSILLIINSLLIIIFS